MKIGKLGVIKGNIIFVYVNRLNLFYTICTIPQFLMELSDDTSSRFECKMCNYSCTRKSHMTQHCETEKHQAKIKSASHASSNACACGKAFELRSSLYNHKKTCKMAATNTTVATPNDTSMSLTVVEKEIATVAKKTQDIADKNEELMDLKTMVQMLLNDRNTMYDKSHDIMAKNHEMMMKNQEVLREMTQQNQQLIQTIQEMTPRLGNGNIITTHNTQFNLNMFLNNECKDAIKLSDFVKTLKITLQDLEYTKTKGIVEGVSSIIVNNLKGMDVHKRPIHCTDLKRETMYVKTDEWIKDEDNSYVKKFIYMASCYQTRIIQEWMDAHPGWETKEKMHVEYQTICKELYKNIECDDNAHKKIIKAFIKEVHIPRTGI